jgi:hypothetical protein
MTEFLANGFCVAKKKDTTGRGSEAVSSSTFRDVLASGARFLPLTKRRRNLLWF